MDKLAQVFADFVRFVRFRALEGNPRGHWPLYIGVGLALTWVVGAGRYWDAPETPLLIRSGATSIVYAVVLAAFIWIVGLALRPERWTYRSVLLMVTMTSLPGILYAIPVERLMPIEIASVVNLVFLLVVATWRMLLYRHFLKTVAKLPPSETLIAWLLPPSVIVAVLSVFGLLNEVMRGMSGDRAPDANELATSAFLYVGFAAWIALPVLIVCFVVMTLRRWRRR
jgi:hypothetical protein